MEVCDAMSREELVSELLAPRGTVLWILRHSHRYRRNNSVCLLATAESSEQLSSPMSKLPDGRRGRLARNREVDSVSVSLTGCPRVSASADPGVTSTEGREGTASSGTARAEDHRRDPRRLANQEVSLVRIGGYPRTATPTTAEFPLDDLD